MPNVRASSGMIGTHRSPKPLSFMMSLSSRTKAIVVATFCLPEPRFTSPNRSVAGIGTGFGGGPGGARVAAGGGGRQRVGGGPARRQLPAERPAPLQQVRHLVRVLARVEVRRQVRVLLELL